MNEPPANQRQDADDPIPFYRAIGWVAPNAGNDFREAVFWRGDFGLGWRLCLRRVRIDSLGGIGWLALEPPCVRSTRGILARRFSFTNLLWQATPVDSRANQPRPPSVWGTPALHMIGIVLSVEQFLFQIPSTGLCECPDEPACGSAPRSEQQHLVSAAVAAATKKRYYFF